MRKIRIIFDVEFDEKFKDFIKDIQLVMNSDHVNKVVKNGNGEAALMVSLLNEELSDGQGSISRFINSIEVVGSNFVDEKETK